MAACSQEELIPSESVQNVAKGIVFETTEGVTRGELAQGEDGKYNFNWYAEFDKVNLYASNVKGQSAAFGGDNTTGAGVADSKFTAFAPAVYKATTSGARGLFTANSDQDWISFKNSGKVVAIATYPTTTTINKVDATDEKVKVDGTEIYVTKEVKSVKINTTVEATQNVVFDYVNAPMLSITEGKREARHQSVSEKMPLDFVRVYPVVRFTGAAVNDSYNKDLGNLNSITLTSKGNTSGDYVLSAQNLAGTAVYENSKNKISDESATSSSITVNVTDGKWTSDKSVYMSILPVTNVAVNSKDAKKTMQLADNMTITYEYDNITLIKTIATGSTGWTEPNSIVKAPVLNIAEEYKYIVTKGDAGVDRKLIVNSGNFPTIYTKDSKNYIIWDDANSQSLNVDGKNGDERVVEITNIDKIEVRNDVNTLGKDQFTSINKFTNLKELAIKNNTTKLTYNAFAGLSSLQTIELTNVNEIEYTNNDDKKNKPINSTSLKNVIMPAFDFSASVNLTKSILNAGVLEKLNMKGVASMKKAYPKEGMSLMGYNKLTEVTVQDGVILGPESFKGCTALSTVNGKVALKGYSEFQNCSSLAKINLSECVAIPEYAFSGATALKEIKVNGANVAPVTIGVNAFYGATSLKNIDLTKTTTIGAGAFTGCTALEGVANTAKGIFELVVNATTVGKEAFKNTNIEYINFSNLNKVEFNLLSTTPRLKEVKFTQKVTFADEVYADTEATISTFGNSSELTLFVDPEQETLANQLVVTNSKGKKVNVTFKTIIKE